MKPSNSPKPQAGGCRLQRLVGRPRCKRGYSSIERERRFWFEILPAMAPAQKRNIGRQIQAALRRTEPEVRKSAAGFDGRLDARKGSG